MRIINAAFREFARHGFKDASTNRIVEEAGIGKGMLFYYFGNKQALFQYIFDYAIQFTERYMAKLEAAWQGSDFFEKYRIANRIKMEAFMENACIFDFLLRMQQDVRDSHAHPDGTVAELYQKFAEWEQEKFHYVRRVIESADVHKFRADIPVERMVRYIHWMLDGYIQTLQTQLIGKVPLSETEMASYWAEYRQILDDLTTLFYQTPPAQEADAQHSAVTPKGDENT